MWKTRETERTETEKEAAWEEAEAGRAEAEAEAEREKEVRIMTTWETREEREVREAREAGETGEAARIAQLRNTVKEIIYDGVPINNVCPYCGNGIDLCCLIDKDSKIDRGDWDKMADKIIVAVERRINDVLPTEVS